MGCLSEPCGIKQKMIDYDFHIHTEYCGHASGMTVEAICRQADRLGLRLIAITDHIYGPDEQATLREIRRQVRQARPRCRVIIGAEIDVDGVFDDGRLVVDDVSDLDYVIAGFHYVPTLGHYPRSPDDRRMDTKDFLRLWEKTLLGIVSNPAIDTLAHPGRLLASCIDLDVHFDSSLAVFKEAAALSARNQIAWELNELTGRRLPVALYRQWIKIYQIALEAGVHLIYGSDAHDPDSIGTCTFSQMILQQLPAGALSAPEDLPAAKRWKSPISS
jgi:HisJ family histidinol phosphate phosphatase